MEAFSGTTTMMRLDIVQVEILISLCVCACVNLGSKLTRENQRWKYEPAYRKLIVRHRSWHCEHVHRAGDRRHAPTAEHSRTAEARSARWTRHDDENPRNCVHHDQRHWRQVGLNWQQPSQHQRIRVQFEKVRKWVWNENENAWKDWWFRIYEPRQRLVIHQSWSSLETYTIFNWSFILIRITKQ